jgi:hypothetical protein
MEIVNWIVAHWEEIVGIYLGLVGVASIIVRLTPTLKDDTVLHTIVAFTGKYIALNRK